MKLKQGRIGFAAGTSLAALAVFSSEVFSIDSKTMYANGNASYAALPLAVMISLLILLPAAAVSEGGLAGLFADAFGKAGGAVAAAVVSVGFVRAAAKPMTGFLEVLARLVFDGVPYARILLYIMPVTVLIAWKGFESIGRLALVFSGLIFVSVLIAAASAAPEFEVSRLYPLPSVNADTAGKTLSGTAFALPPLAALLTNEKGLGGKRNVLKTAAAAAALSAVLICFTQLALGLVYPYGILSGLSMPLYRINFLSLRQSYALRLDKLFIMMWLTGCVISCAYLVYSASLLLTVSFSARDVTPAVFTLSAAVFCFATAEFSEKYAAVSFAESFFSRFGALFAAVPILLAAAVGSIRKGRRIPS
ncbi:MAG: GerAB/ArcD/ProY family transporter [Clostridia bacterium]|nr:GerAB/ArcD/ProY family transporter [Clostridia bacterium]